MVDEVSTQRRFERRLFLVCLVAVQGLLSLARVVGRTTHAVAGCLAGRRLRAKWQSEVETRFHFCPTAACSCGRDVKVGGRMIPLLFSTGPSTDKRL